MIRHPRPRLLPLAATLLLAACRSEPAPSAASAEPAKPSASASAPPAAASGSASAAAPAITHQPGTVPAPPVRKPASAEPDAAAPVPPTFTRLPAAKSRKAGAQIAQATFAGKSTLVVTSSAGIESVDVATGAGFSIGPGSPDAFEISADASLLAVARSGGPIMLWDVTKGALLHTISGSASSMTFSADGKRLAIAGESLLAVIDTATGKDVMRAAPDSNPFGLAFGANGTQLVVTGNNIQVAVFAVDSGAKLPGGGGAETGGTFGIALSPDGRFAAASAPAGHGLQVFDVHAWAPRTLVVVPEGACQEHMGVAFSPNGRFLFGYGGSRWVKGFETGSWKPYASYHAPAGRALASAAADLSRVVVTREDGRDAVIVNVGNGAETKLDRPFAESASYAISNDGLHVAGTANGAVRVWSAKTGTVEYEEQP